MISKIIISMQYLYSKQLEFTIYFLHINSGSINLLFIGRKTMHEYKWFFSIVITNTTTSTADWTSFNIFLLCGKNIKLCINLAKMGSGIKIDLSKTYSVRKYLFVKARHLNADHHLMSDKQSSFCFLNYIYSFGFNK